MTCFETDRFDANNLTPLVLLFFFYIFVVLIKKEQKEKQPLPNFQKTIFFNMLHFGIWKA